MLFASQAARRHQGLDGAGARRLAGFGTAETQQFFRIIDEQAGRMSGLIGDRHQTLAAQAGSHLTLRLRTRAVLRSRRVRSSCGRPPGMWSRSRSSLVPLHSGVGGCENARLFGEQPS